MKADPILLQLTYSGVIAAFAEMGGITYKEALDKFYNSVIYQEIYEGISDMHCRSENYLAEYLLEEFGMKKAI